MSAEHWAIAAYVAGLGLMLGYGALLWLEGRVLKRRGRLGAPAARVVE